MKKLLLVILISFGISAYSDEFICPLTIGNKSDDSSDLEKQIVQFGCKPNDTLEILFLKENWKWGRIERESMFWCRQDKFIHFYKESVQAFIICTLNDVKARKYRYPID